MATLAQIRGVVRRKLKDPDGTAFSDADINAEINRSVRYYSNQRFWFNEDLVQVTLTTNTQTIPNIPADLKSELRVNGLMLIDNQVKITLEKMSPDVFFNQDYEQTGRPLYYTYRDGEFLILPIPQEDYPLVVRYLKKYSDLSTDGDSNDFTNNAEDLITLHTLKNMYNEDKQDRENGSTYQALEQMELKQLQKTDVSRLGSGQLYGYSILN